MYTYNGKEYSLEQIQKMATDNGYGEDYQTYLDDHPDFKESGLEVEEPTKVEKLPGIGLDFQPGPAEGAVVGP